MIAFFDYMDIRLLTSIDKNMAYCLLKGSESGSFCLRSPVLSEVEVSSQSSKENKATGMIADNQNELSNLVRKFKH